MKLHYVLGLTALLALPFAHAGEAPAGAPPAHAHGYHQGPGGMPGGELDKDPALKLSDEQKAQIRAIHEEARGQHAKIHEETRDKVKQVLTPEQQQKLEDLREQRHEKMKERAGRGDKEGHDKDKKRDKKDRKDKKQDKADKKMKAEK